MANLLIVLVLLIAVLASVCILHIKNGQWFQRKRLGDLLMQIETADSTDDIIELANELELLKANLIGSEIDHTIKENPYVISLDEPQKHPESEGEALVENNVVSIFKND
ncbi:hypothetical protein [Pseudoalteromonas luteoviolacea]|uniref:Uncharacterized protein n=1 Tax=Pseudoalteromonas luteoviolacea S4060-1 TaxID=1365257 RepID=A0A167KVM2_9GAMM|nr:hypothetical protein [Pseudoalteromonas luteoviolacea]KZN63357.1 hypothetical protein N478_03650 [Pseudoalteromonas luteoviolacea S4060-1]